MLQAAELQDAESLRTFLLVLTSMQPAEAAQTLFGAVAGTSPQHPMTAQMDRLAGIIRAHSYGFGSLPLSAVGPGPGLHFVPGFGPVARMSAASIGPAPSLGSVSNNCDKSGYWTRSKERMFCGFLQFLLSDGEPVNADMYRIRQLAVALKTAEGIDVASSLMWVYIYWNIYMHGMYISIYVFGVST